MAVTVGKIDEIIKEYLLYRGLISTSKQLESELKNEKEKKFRVDKIMDILHSHINNHDLNGLREYWQFLDQRLFSRLEQTYAPSIRKLETSLLKLYVVSAVQSNKPEKVMEFFEKMTSELQGQAEWRDWFVLPFTKNPEETRIFAMYFTRQWQDTLFLTLHNFLSVIVRSMVLPSALEYEEEARKIAKLQDENNRYKNMLRELEGNKANLPSDGSLVLTTPVGPPPAPSSFELMDDFSVISQDSLTTHNSQTNQPRAQQLRSFIRNISSSPIMGRKTSSPVPSSANKQASNNNSQTNHRPASGRSRNSSGNNMSKSSGQQQTGMASGCTSGKKEDGKSKVKVVDSHSKTRAKPGFNVATPRPGNTAQGGHKQGNRQHTEAQSVLPPGSDQEKTESREDAPLAEDDKPYILVNQDEYPEHKACITHCRINNTGQKMATADVDGVVKIWCLQPVLVTEATNICKSSVLSLDWVHSNRLLLGTKTGSVCVFDDKERRILKEVMMDSAYPRVISLTSNPNGTSYVCSAVGRSRLSGTADGTNIRIGRLAIWDLKTMKIERALCISTNLPAINWSSYNHNGQMIITGAADGNIRLFDTRTADCISKWSAHIGEVYTVSFSLDQTSCYSIGADGKFAQWSINKTGQQLGCVPLHQGAVGPFVYTGHGGYRQVQTPKGKLFALEPEGKHVVTCAPTGAQIYKITKDGSMLRSLYLGGHRSPVVTVDWSPAADCRLCLSGSMEGRVRVSSVIQP